MGILILILILRVGEHTKLFQFFGARYTSSPVSTTEKSEFRATVRSETMDSTVRMTSSPVANDISRSSCAELAHRYVLTIMEAVLSCLCELWLPIRP